jgi:hypothetical protein
VVLANDLPPICALFFMLPWAAIVIGVIAYQIREAKKVHFGSRTYASLDEFVVQFGATIGLWGTRASGSSFANRPGLEGVHFSGTLADGHSAQVNFSQRAERGPSYDGHFCVAVDEAPTLVVTREEWTTRLSKWLGLVKEVEVGYKAFDDRFLLEAKDAQAVKALARSEFRDEIDEIFRFTGVHKLELGNGTLAVAARVGDLTPESARSLLELLVRAARTLERVPITVRILGGERRAFLGVTTHARCGYCHEDVTGTEPDLVACDRCATVVHADCWAELGRCPVIGCPGHVPETGSTRVPEGSGS